MLAKRASQYDSDFYGWTREQAAILREIPADDARLDVANLADEIEDIGHAEVLAISSLLRQTIIHLLKLAIVPDSPSAPHWFDEVVAFQGDAVLAFSPGLKQRLDLAKIWPVGCNGATRSLAKNAVAVPRLPASCPLSLDDLLNPDFDPEAAVRTLSAAIQAAA